MDICKMAAEYGLDTLAIAVITVIVTGIIKIPVKRIAEKTGFGKKVTKFITLIPIASGFCVTVAVSFTLTGRVAFGQAFFRQWLSAVSLSLAIYAFWEKFAPSKKAALSGEELEESKAAADRLKTVLKALPLPLGEAAQTPSDEEEAARAGVPFTNGVRSADEAPPADEVQPADEEGQPADSKEE